MPTFQFIAKCYVPPVSLEGPHPRITQNTQLVAATSVTPGEPGQSSPNPAVQKAPWSSSRVAEVNATQPHHPGMAMPAPHTVSSLLEGPLHLQTSSDRQESPVQTT